MRKILEGVAAPFVQSQVLARRVFLQQRKPDHCHSFIAPEWIGLIGPVQETEGVRIAMEMMLGLLMIKQRLCDCGIDHDVHSSGSFGANMLAKYHRSQFLATLIHSPPTPICLRPSRA